MRTTRRRLSAVLISCSLCFMGSVVVAPAAEALRATPDDTWMTNGPVFAMARSGGTLFVGGRFSLVREEAGVPGADAYPVANLAAIDLATGRGISSWHPRVAGGSGEQVRSLEVVGNRLYVGGNFAEIGGDRRRNLAAVDTRSGKVVRGFRPAVGGSDSVVHTLLASKGTLYAGGEFESVGSRVRRRLAAFDIAHGGSLDPRWRPSANRNVRSLILAPGSRSIFAGGAFTEVNGRQRRAVAQLGRSTGAVRRWRIPNGTIEPPQTAWSLVANRRRLFGGFGRLRNFVAAFALDQGATGEEVWRFGATGNVQSVALSVRGSRLFVGGHFGTHIEQRVCNGRRLLSLGVVSPATGRLDCDWLPAVTGPNEFGGVWSLLATRSRLWVGGDFTNVTGAEQTYLARFTL